MNIREIIALTCAGAVVGGLGAVIAQLFLGGEINYSSLAVILAACAVFSILASLESSDDNNS